MTETTHTRKTVVLADPRWDGHHPTYLLEFTASLLRLGHRVIGLCREPGELMGLASDVCEGLGLDAGEVLWAGRLDDPDRAYLRPGQDHDPVSTVLRWRCLGKAINRAEKESAWQADFVFLPWLDSYLRFQPTKFVPSLFQRLPWSGLYFRNHHFSERGGVLFRAAKGDRSLRNSRCKAVGVLDERFEREMEAETGKNVIVFPDITDETVSDEPGSFARDILRKAKGRKIIGMVSLEKRKGFLTMLKIAEAVAGREDWYFVAAGPYAAATCSGEEQAYVENLARRSGPDGEFDHIHLELPGGRINDGNDFNSLIKVFDVIYAAYEDFEGSSNALTKGAVFECPIVATRGECVGGRVEKFGLGLTIAQGSVPEGEEAIRRILAGIDWDGQPLALRYKDYHQRHDRARLDEVFRQILA